MNNIEIVKNNSFCKEGLNLTLEHKKNKCFHFDLSVAPKIHRLIDKYFGEVGFLDLHLNCEHIDYIDSSGIGVLISIACSLKKENKKLFLCKVNSKMNKTLELVKVSDMIDVCYECFSDK